jgi:hypothetical protein
MAHRDEADALPDTPGLTSPTFHKLWVVDVSQAAPGRLSNKAQSGIAKELLPDYRMDAIGPDQQVTLYFVSVGE